MKKPVIMIAMGVLVVIFFLQYMQRKSAAPSDLSQAASQTADVLPGGVALPAESTVYAASPAPEPVPFTQPSAKIVFNPPASMGGKGALPAIQADFAKQQLCSDGKSLNDILASHGKTWGYSAYDKSAFTKPENDAVYGLLAKFFSCQAVVYGDLEMCNFLPGVQNKLDKYFHTPHYQCMDPSTKVLFYAYANGKFKSDVPCYKFLDGDNLAGAKAKLPPDFCRGAADGFAALCSNPKAGSNKEKCREAFPSSRDDCKTEGNLENFSLYSAIRDNNLSGCPEKYMSECSAFFTKSQSACQPILQNLGGVYCQAAAMHQQANSSETQRKLAEEKKKADQKIMEDINKKARKALGKE